jgi:hypothetical protein
LVVVRRWELDEAEALDGQQQLGKKIATALETARAALSAS